jgi:chemotaxis signal transduction protein
MLDFQLDDDIAAQPDGSLISPPAPERKVKALAQGVQCGDYLLAFDFEWARQIIEQFELVPVPRAPSWILGAVNVNGLIVPVVDIANYFSQSATPAQVERGQRLLLGGIAAEDSDNALAIIFSQTPTQLEYDAQPIAAPQALPLRLQEVCRQAAVDDMARTYIEIDPEKLMDALSAELSVI